MSQDVQQLPRLLSVDELAALLRTTPKALRNRVARGEIPGVVKISERTTRFRADVIEQWLDAATMTTLVDGNVESAQG